MPSVPSEQATHHFREVIASGRNWWARAVVGTVNIGSTYKAGNPITLGNGLQVSLAAGDVTNGDSFTTPVAGNPAVWVEIRVPEGFEGPRFVPPTAFAGRLVPIADAGLRHAGLVASVREHTGTTVPKDAWILIDGSSPRASRWALALVLLFAGFSLWNVLATGRLLARVRDR